MPNALTLRFNTQMQLDIQRITLELGDLQRQLASGLKSNDLMGFGAGVAQIVNAQGLLAQTDARAAAADQLSARFDVQAAALSRAAQGGQALARALNDAVSTNSGAAVGVDLELAFAAVTSALNERWNGQPLFAGERIGEGPVVVSSLNQLLGLAVPNGVFDEAQRHQILELESGAQITLAERASEFSSSIYVALRDLKVLLDSYGGSLPDPMPQSLRDGLQALAQQVESATREITAAEGRSGRVQRRISDERDRLQARSNLLVKEIGAQADADVPTIALKLSQLQAQYEATAKVFGDLSKLSLLHYL
jgi:flagellin-like hook-associated protein FlgL